MKDILEFRQFVPSEICLSCDGCCRFREEKSEWRPRVAMEEKVPAFFLKDNNQIYSRQNVDIDNYLRVSSCQGACLCGFLKNDNHCAIYDQRPFECGLYPFLITRDESGVAVSAHLSCPYLQEKYGTSEFEEYAAYLKETFATNKMAVFLKRNADIAGEYEEFKDEIARLFTVQANEGALFWEEDLLERQEQVSAFLAKSLSTLSPFHFSQIALWQEHFHFFTRTIDKSLCIFATNHLGTFLYLPPLGDNIKTETIAECFAVMDEVNQGSGVSRIENVPQERLKYFSEEKYAFYEKGKECRYEREDIARLKGERYKSKRSDRNQFLKNNTYEYLSYEPEHKEECLTLLNEWTVSRQRKGQDDVSHAMLLENNRVQQLALKYYQELGLMARVVKVDGCVKAYTFGYPVNGREFCVLFETVDLTIKGLPVFIFNQFVDDPQVRCFKFINVMDDFCADNVNKTKMSYRPGSMVPVYVVTKKG